MTAFLLPFCVHIVPRIWEHTFYFWSERAGARSAQRIIMMRLSFFSVSRLGVLNLSRRFCWRYRTRVSVLSPCPLACVPFSKGRGILHPSTHAILAFFTHLSSAVIDLLTKTSARMLRAESKARPTKPNQMKKKNAIMQNIGTECHHQVVEWRHREYMARPSTEDCERQNTKVRQRQLTPVRLEPLI